MRECSSPQRVMCHVSRVTCNVSRVTCHMSCVTCHIFFFLQSGEAYLWRVCYQRGQPRLVSVYGHFDVRMPFALFLPWLCQKVQRPAEITGWRESPLDQPGLNRTQQQILSGSWKPYLIK